MVTVLVTPSAQNAHQEGSAVGYNRHWSVVTVLVTTSAQHAHQEGSAVGHVTIAQHVAAHQKMLWSVACLTCITHKLEMMLYGVRHWI